MTIKETVIWLVALCSVFYVLLRTQENNEFVVVHIPEALRLADDGIFAAVVQMKMKCPQVAVV